MRIPREVEEKVNSFAEWRMGANKVDLVLRNGRIVKDVYLAWGRDIVRIGEHGVIDFQADDIVDAIDHSSDP